MPQLVDGFLNSGVQYLGPDVEKKILPSAILDQEAALLVGRDSGTVLKKNVTVTTQEERTSTDFCVAKECDRNALFISAQ